MATRTSQFRAATPALVEHRRAPRYPVTVTRATVHAAGAEPLDAVLHDLSIYGCRLATPVDYAPDERLTLRLDGGAPIEAAVVWCRDGFVGCRFDRAIARDVVRDLTLTIR